MGYDLTNDRGDYLRFSPSGWSLALWLAESYGWQPEGTTLSQIDEESGLTEWSGGYWTNDGQRISNRDALSIADACERALSDPEYETRAVGIRTRLNEELAKEVPEFTFEPVDRSDIVKFRDRVQELIDFCRKGGFIIE